MKTKFLLTAACASLLSLSAYSQATLQVIHNCADPAASVVDVYVNGTLTLDDFQYLTATPILPLPSGVNLDIAVAPGNSSSVLDALATFPVTLAAGESYVAVASGLLSPPAFAANPDGRATGFTLLLQSDIETNSGPSDASIRVVHGSTDAPGVDVIARGVGALVDNALYGDITPTHTVPASDYILDITPANDNSTIVASFEAPLSALAGTGSVVFASGFLNPAANQNGQAFGLYVATPSGAVLPLSSISQARLQVIHNAADPAAASVDVYLNGILALDNFSFRTATPYIDVPADVNIAIGIAPSTSNSVADTIKNFNVTLQNGKTYVAIANGLVAPGFASNPDGRNTDFTLILSDGMKEAADNGANTDFRVLHGATDAPGVDVIARGVATLVDNALYTDFTGYLSVPSANYTLDITPANDNSTIIVSYQADLSGLAGGSAVVFASGFLDPTANQNGPAFGLFVALSNGTVLQLNTVSTARLQVIHNAADPAASSVDVYLNGSILLNDFAFRAATPFIDAPAGVLLNIGVAPATSTSAADTLKNFQVTLANGQTYVAVANGLVAPGFAANPDGRNTDFTLFLSQSVRESGTNPSNVDFIVLHGATDAPTVDVIANGALTLVDNAAYGDITPYLSVPAADYLLDITPAAGSPVVASFTAPLSGLAGGAAVVFASGFLDPTANQNGPAFGLFAALANGTVVPFSNVTGVNESSIVADRIFPNPATDKLNVILDSKGDVAVSLLDIAGASVYNAVINSNSEINLNNIAPGTYFLRLQNNGATQIQKVIITK